VEWPRRLRYRLFTHLLLLRARLHPPPIGLLLPVRVRPRPLQFLPQALQSLQYRLHPLVHQPGSSTATVLQSCRHLSRQRRFCLTLTPTPSTSTIITPPTSTYLSLPPYANTTLSKVSVPATSTQASSTCAATTLTGSSTSGNYQYPHLIIPISSSTPSTAAGTSYFGTISSNTSTIFNFDIPTSYAGSTCNLIFLLPLQSQLETASYTFSGSGGVEFEQLSSAATQSTTWDNAPSVEKDLGEFTLSEGSSTLIESFACPAGQTVAFEMSAVGDTYLYYFQDWNPSPLGLYITVC